METPPQVDRRKACDTCSRKKIKCDMMQPSCSNCQMYQTECKTTASASAARRRAGPKRSISQAQAEGPVALDDSAARIDTLEDRVGTVETQLQVLQQTVSAAQTHQRASHSNGSSGVHRSPPAPLPLFQPPPASVASSALTSSADGSSGAAVPAYLPPLDDILPVAERFFEHTNHLIPLFDKSEFLCLLMDWFSPSPAAGSYSPSYGLSASRDGPNGAMERAVFAAINVVLALSHRVVLEPSHAFNLTADDPMVDQYRRNVEQLIPELVSRAESLVALQVLLGMMLLYIGSRDEQPATVLIGSAIQLCNRLRLNSREENEKYPTPARLQRERVFWIAYILDKEISQRYHTPFLLVDDDIDLEWPTEQSVDGTGDIRAETLQGPVRFSYFARRVALATIQGETYDQLYSNRASHPARVTPQQRQARVFLLDARLECWRRTIPYAFQAENVAETLGADPHVMAVSDRQRGALIHMAELHFMHMACLVRIHGIWSHDAEWQRLLSGFAQQAVKFAGLPGSRCDGHRPPAPKQWDKCVKLGRDCLRLIQNMPLTTRNIWSTGYAYISSLIIILANLFQCDDLGQLEADQALTRQGLFIFSKLKEASSWQPLHRLHGVVRELDRRAAHEIDLKRLRMDGITAAAAAAPLRTDEDVAVTMAGVPVLPEPMQAAQTLVPDGLMMPQPSPPDPWTFTA